MQADLTFFILVFFWDCHFYLSLLSKGWKKAKKQKRSFEEMQGSTKLKSGYPIESSKMYSIYP